MGDDQQMSSSKRKVENDRVAHTTSRQVGTGNYNKYFYRKHAQNSHPVNNSNTLFDFDLLEDSSTNVENTSAEDDVVTAHDTSPQHRGDTFNSGEIMEKKLDTRDLRNHDGG